MRIGTITDFPDIALQAALTARGAEIVAYKLAPLTAFTDTRSLWPRRHTRRTGRTPIDARATELVDQARADGISQFRISASAEEIKLAWAVRERSGLSFSISAQENADLISTDDVTAAAFVTVPSHFERARLLSRVGERLSGKVHVLPLPIDRATLPTRIEWKPSSEVVALFPANPDNGISLAVQAAKAAKVERLWLVTPNADLGAVRRIVKRFEFSARTKLIAPKDRDHLLKVLQRAPATFVPALTPPPMAPVIEAMALGSPIIAPMLGALPELIDATCGWLYRPADLGDAAACLSDALAADARKGDAMSTESQRRISTGHDSGIAADTLMGLIASSAA